MARTIQEITITGAYNSDESELMREAGYRYQPCRWCTRPAYTREGLCPGCFTTQEEHGLLDQ